MESWRKPFVTVTTSSFGGDAASVSVGDVAHAVSGRSAEGEMRVMRASEDDEDAAAAVRLPAPPLRRDSLGGQHLVLQSVHAGGGLVDPAREGDRALEDRRQLGLVLDARLRV